MRNGGGRGKNNLRVDENDHESCTHLKCSLKWGGPLSSISGSCSFRKLFYLRISTSGKRKTLESGIDSENRSSESKNVTTHNLVNSPPNLGLLSFWVDTQPGTRAKAESRSCGSGFGSDLTRVHMSCYKDISHIITFQGSRETRRGRSCARRVGYTSNAKKMKSDNHNDHECDLVTLHYSLAP
jgi:hypothetical protein